MQQRPNDPKWLGCSRKGIVALSSQIIIQKQRAIGIKRFANLYFRDSKAYIKELSESSY